MEMGSPRPKCAAFTLIEVLVSMSVLILIVLGVLQLLNSASSLANNAKAALESDNQARMVLDCMSQDFGQIVKENVDAYFPSGTSLSTPSGEMFFYTGRAGYAVAGATNLNTASLTGYRVNTNSSDAGYNQLERYSANTQWDGDNTNSIVFLTYGTTGSFAPLAASTIAANAAVQPTSTDVNFPDFHVLGEDVFRMEFCYQLKDGTCSSEPALYTAPTTWGSGTFFHAAAGAPSSGDGAPNYAVGSRWYDSSAQRAYVCTSVSAGTTADQAVWRAAGWQDVSALIVTIATMDEISRALVKSTGKDLQSVAKALPTVIGTDPSKPAIAATALAAQQWLAVINGGTLATLIPKRTIAALRVYQRYLYLDAQ